MQTNHAVALIVVLTLVGCGPKPDTRAAADTAGPMAGMPMGMAGMEMMPTMRAHLDSLGELTPAEIQARMAAHQDLAARMMDAMGADMRGMGMQPDSAWAALGDSLRQDLAEMPGLTGDALGDRVRAHVGRMRRMLARHEGMMRM